jgi:hypothetical protein
MERQVGDPVLPGIEFAIGYLKLTPQEADELRRAARANITALQQHVERKDAREKLLRIHLGLNPGHDILEAVRVLYDDGREAFEKVRGPRCEYAHQWKPD